MSINSRIDNTSEKCLVVRVIQPPVLRFFFVFFFYFYPPPMVVRLNPFLRSTLLSLGIFVALFTTASIVVARITIEGEIV